MLSADDEAEVVVINLMGEIQPQRFADVMLALEVDAPAVQNIQVADASGSGVSLPCSRLRRKAAALD